MKTYQVTLPDEFAAMVDRLVGGGKFESVEHLVMYAVSQVEEEVRADDRLDKDRLRAEVQKGVDSAGRGEVAELDMPTVWRQVERRLAEGQTEAARAAGDANGRG